METEAEINLKIIKIITVIQENYPELSKYIEEMPVDNLGESNPEINIKNLQNYYDSLVNWFRDYVAEHQLNYTNQRTDSGHL